MTTTLRWFITNGRGNIPLCERCQQPRYEGHTNCVCEKNHPDPCFREDFQELTNHLAHAQRIAGENADMAAALLGKLAEIAELANLVITARENTPVQTWPWREVLKICSEPLAEITGEKTDGNS